MQPDRPVPIDMKVCDLDSADRLVMRCPTCNRQVGEQGTNLRLELPADMLLIRYIVRHFCVPCYKRSGVRVRPNGWIPAGPRSGAEGGHKTHWAR
jgi:hypothetical protein